jgi:ATP-dependent Clp protease ATP-binding subunit ClpB
MTSNIASDKIMSAFGADGKAGSPDFEHIGKLVNEELSLYFRPEFLNRVDDVVVFRPLGKTELKEIAFLLLDKVVKRLEGMDIKAECSDGLVEEIAENGFDPKFGARPMKRAVQRIVENNLAKWVIEGKIKPQTTVKLGYKGGLTVEEA